VRKYAIWGTATSAEHEAWVRAIGKQFEADGFLYVDDIADADFVLNMFDAEDPKAFRRASRGTYSAAFYEMPEAPDGATRQVGMAGVEEILSEQLATRVQIQMNKKRGRVIIEFGSADDLERIVSEIVGSGPGLSPD